MCLEIETRSECQIIRLPAGSFAEADVTAARNAVAQALTQGIKRIGLSIPASETAGYIVSGLLVLCDEVVRRQQGSLSLIGEATLGGNNFLGVCEILQIPMYCSEEEFLMAALELNPSTATTA